jgi:hypothetical protein
MALDMKTHAKCRMTYSDPIPFIEYYSMGLPKYSRHNWIINHEYRDDKHICPSLKSNTFFHSLQYLQESGLLAYWIKQYTPDVDKCKVDKSIKPSEKNTSLTLVDISSAFLLFAIGVALSLLVFLFEIIASSKEKKSKIKDENKTVKNVLFGI